MLFEKRFVKYLVAAFGADAEDVLAAIKAAAMGDGPDTDADVAALDEAICEVWEAVEAAES